MRRIALVGVFPPPIGGVSIHIKRLQRLLRDRGILSHVYDVGAGDSKALCVIPTPNTLILSISLYKSDENTVHYHGSSWIQRVALILIKLITGKRIIYTFHSFKEDFKDLSWSRRIFATIVAKQGDHFIATASHIREKLLGIGVLPNKIVTIPAFIPPSTELNNVDFNTVPDNVWRFIEQHNPIIAANAYQIAFYKGRDLYGVDMCVYLCAQLVKTFPELGFVFCLPNIGYAEYFRWLQTVIQQKGIKNNFLFVSNRFMEFYPILTKTNVFVRPTNTDGDAISIREALHYGVPTVASDAVNRPSAVILFETRNQEDFSEKTKTALERRRRTLVQCDNVQHHITIESYLRVYDSDMQDPL